MSAIENTGPDSLAAKKLVRSFSDDLEPESANEPLGKALKGKENLDRLEEAQLVRLRTEWNSLLVSTTIPETVPLEQEQLYQSSQRLAKVWQAFIAKLPDDQKPDASQPPNLATLRNAVVQARESWDLKRDTTTRGKIRKKFSSTMERFHDHKDLLAIIPQDDKYVCLLTGALSAIAKATMNHASIAGDIATTLDQLDEDMQYWKRQIEVHRDNPYMRAYVIRLFVIIFEMLGDIFQSWYSSKWDRFRHSFDSNFFQRTVQSRREEIQCLKARLENEGNLTSQKSIRDTERTVRDIQLAIGDLPSQKDIRTITETTTARILAEIELRLGSQLQKMLREQAVQHPKTNGSGRMVKAADPGDRTNGNGDDDDDDDDSGSESITLPSQRMPLAISALLPRLQNYVQNKITEELAERAGDLQVDFTTFLGIQDWSSSQTPACLWIEGPYEVESPSQNTLTSAMLLAAARAAKVPVIAYFCHEFAAYSGPEDYQESLLRSMILSLIAQSWEYRMAFDQADQLATKMVCLEDTNVPLEDIIQVLELLMASQPRLLHCFIDGLNLAEDKFNECHGPILQRLANCLCPDKNAPSSQPFKTCFTTDGSIDVLQDGMLGQRIDRVAFEFESAHRRGRDTTVMDDLDLHISDPLGSRD